MTMTSLHVAWWLLWLAVPACLLVACRGRRLLAPLARLAKATTHLPAKLLRHHALAWPYSLVPDIEALAGRLRSMVDVLRWHVQESQRTNETLERRVQE